jgi:hypothetical protein
MPSFWLPPDARGNGIPAARWAELIIVSRRHADELRDVFRASGVPACAAPAERPWAGDQDHRVWVDPARYATAENVLLREMTKRSG